MSHSIVPYRPDLERASAAAVGRAFVDDPVVRWMVGGDLARTTWCMRQGIRMAARHGCSFVVETPVAGGAFWLPPGQTPIVPLTTQIALGNWQSPFVCGVGATLRILAREEDADARYRRDLREPCWVLDLLAVDPARQGHGLGAALLRHGLERVDLDRLPAYLLTYNPNNVAIYRRFGFEVVEERAHGKVPTGWSMRRPARG